MKIDKDTTFVLEPVGDAPHNHASRAALLYYADDIRWSNRELSNDIHAFVLELIKVSKRGTSDET